MNELANNTKEKQRDRETERERERQRLTIMTMYKCVYLSEYIKEVKITPLTETTFLTFS